MALQGTVKLPVFGTVSKKTATFGGLGAVVFVLGIYWYRQHKAATSASSATSSAAATVIDPAGNVCSAVNPATGYCPGTPEDTAAQEQATGFNPFLDSGGAGSALGFTTGTPIGTSEAFATNAAWAQAAETYLQSNGADATAAALAKYISGQQMTTAQQSIAEEAIAAEGYPPVAGANGYPPSMNVVGNTSSVNNSFSVPNVTGLSTQTAIATLTAAGFATVNINGPQTGVVWSQTPAGGATATQGGSIDIASSATGKPPEVPQVTGMSATQAQSTLTAAGYRYSLNGPSTGKIWSQTPPAGQIFSAGGTVDIASSATGKPPSGV